MATEPWVKSFRRQVKLSCSTGWGVRDRHGKVQLRLEGVGAVTLPDTWSEQGSITALPRIQQIFKRYETDGLSLDGARSNTNTASSHQTIDWDALVEGFREQRPAVSDKTWKEHYAPVLCAAKALMLGNKRKPRDGEDLLLQALKRWEQGSRMRQICRRNLSAFLTWAVQRNLLKPCYLPPLHIPETRKPKRIGYPLSDSQIVRLLEDVTDERWRFAIQLCAEFGLRPEELRWLRPTDGDGVRCLYRKSQGGRKGSKTEPRQLHSLPVLDMDGTPLQWNLGLRLAAGESLPPLRGEGKGAQALTTYLNRRSVWQALKAEAEGMGEQLTAYSFRHRYAKECHRCAVPVADIANAMGHSIDTHLLSYARFTPDSTAVAFEKAQRIRDTRV